MKLSHVVTVLAVSSFSTGCNFGASKKSNPAPEVVPENKGETTTGTEGKVDPNVGTNTSGEGTVTPKTTTDAEVVPAPGVAPAPVPAPGGEVITQPDPALPANPGTPPVSPAPAFSPADMAAAIKGTWQISEFYCHDRPQDTLPLTYAIYEYYTFNISDFAERKLAIATYALERVNVKLSNASSSETHSSADMLITKTERPDQSVRLRLSKDAQPVLTFSFIDEKFREKCPGSVVAYKMLRK